MWRIYRAIEGIFNIKSKRHCSCRNNVILSANKELHDLEFPEETQKSLKKFEFFKGTQIGTQIGTQKELKFLSSFLSCYFPKTFGYLEISNLKCYIES